MNDDLPQAQSSEMLQNPTRVPKKGRPIERENRKKTLVEQRGDEQKKKAKQPDKKPTTTGNPRAKKGLSAASTTMKKYEMFRHVGR